MINVTGCRVLVNPLNWEDTDEVVKRAKALGLQFEKDERKAKVAMETGIVLQLGPKVNPDYTEGAQVGDKIGFTKYGGKFVKDGEKELLIINDEDILCVYKDAE